MAAILENGHFPAYAVNFRIPSSALMKLGVFYAQIKCQSLCVQKYMALKARVWTEYAVSRKPSFKG